MLHAFVFHIRNIILDHLIFFYWRWSWKLNPILLKEFTPETKRTLTCLTIFILIIGLFDVDISSSHEQMAKPSGRNIQPVTYSVITNNRKCSFDDNQHYIMVHFRLVPRPDNYDLIWFIWNWPSRKLRYLDVIVGLEIIV